MIMKLNDDDRSQWIDNDEGLYRWWKSTRQSKRLFIRENRDKLTRLILAVLNRQPGQSVYQFIPPYSRPSYGERHGNR